MATDSRANSRFILLLPLVPLVFSPILSLTKFANVIPVKSATDRPDSALFSEKDGKFHGRGTFFSKRTGETYQGGFRKGRFHGHRCFSLTLPCAVLLKCRTGQEMLTHVAQKIEMLCRLVWVAGRGVQISKDGKRLSVLFDTEKDDP